jgi:hypothetical protein
MKKPTIITLGLTLPLLLLHTSILAEALRLTPVEQTVHVITGSTGINVILVEGSLPEARTLHLLDGPGMVLFDKSIKRWHWIWQPSEAEAGRSFLIKLRDSKSGKGCTFTVKVNAFVKPPNLTKHRAGFTGIPLLLNVKQVGLDGKYAVRIHYDDSLVLDTIGPDAWIKPVFMQDEQKKLRIDVMYQYPLTEQFVKLYSWQETLRYPPMRAPGSFALNAGKTMQFKVAYGMPPNSYIPIQSRYLLVESKGYFDSVATNVGIYDSTDDPFSMFPKRRSPRSDSLWRPGFDFVLNPTEKHSEITEKTGRFTIVKLTDPMTGESCEVEVRIFPPRETLSKQQE